MRGALVVLDRWCGLFIAAFLFIAGLTGAVIWVRKCRARTATKSRS